MTSKQEDRDIKKVEKEVDKEIKRMDPHHKIEFFKEDDGYTFQKGGQHYIGTIDRNTKAEIVRIFKKLAVELAKGQEKGHKFCVNCGADLK